METDLPLCGCARCGSEFRSATPLLTARGSIICDACERYYAACDSCGRIVRTADLTDPGIGDDLCHNCMSNYFTCDSCGGCEHVDNGGHLDGGRVCESCYEDSYYCDHCGERVSSNRWDCEQDCCESCGEEGYANFRHGQMGSLHGDPTERFPQPRLLGLELEFIVPYGPCIKPPTEWGTTKGDGSVGGDGHGVEFASRPCSGSKFEQMVDAVLAALRERRCHVNDSCGMHLHIDMNGFSARQRERIIYWWRYSEQVWFALVNPNRKHNEFCTPVYNVSNSYIGDSRYNALNVSAYNKHGTFELRLHHGTLERDEILNFASAALNFFQSAADKTMPHESADMDLTLFPLKAPTARVTASDFSRFLSFFNDCPTVVSDGIKRALREQYADPNHLT